MKTMLSLSQIENDLKEALKAKDRLALEALRGLKTRIQNEKVAKMKEDLSEDEILALIRSELKKRREAAESFKTGGRTELMEKELGEADVFQKYLPQQMSEEQIAQMVESMLSGQAYTTGDFGKLMGQLKLKAGNAADGALLAKVLKEKLK